MATNVITNGGRFNNPNGVILAGGTPTTDVASTFVSPGNHSFNLTDNNNRSTAIATGLNGINFTQTIDDRQKIVDDSVGNVMNQGVNKQSTVYVEQNKDLGMVYLSGGSYHPMYWTQEFRLFVGGTVEDFAPKNTPASTGYGFGSDYAVNNPGYAIKQNSTIITG